MKLFEEINKKLRINYKYDEIDWTLISRYQNLSESFMDSSS